MSKKTDAELLKFIEGGLKDPKQENIKSELEMLKYMVESGHGDSIRNTMLLLHLADKERKN